MRRPVLCVVLVVAVALGLSGCGGGDAGGSTDGRRYLVLPEGTPGLVVAEGPAGEGYGSGALRSAADGGTGTVAMVQPQVPAGFDALTAGAASATLPNGITVFYVCAGRSTSGGADGSSSAGTVAGPLMVLARVDGGYLDVEDTPTDTGACTPPTTVDGPLVDVAASLRWVDEAEFRRLLAAHPAPERTTTPATG